MSGLAREDPPHEPAFQEGDLYFSRLIYPQALGLDHEINQGDLVLVDEGDRTLRVEHLEVMNLRTEDGGLRGRALLEELLVFGLLLAELKGGQSGGGVPKGEVALRSEQKEKIS